MKKFNKLRIIKMIYPLFGLAIFVILLWFLSRSNSLIKDLLSFQSFFEQTKNILPKVLILILLFFIFKLFYVIVIEFVMSKFRKTLLSESKYISINKLVRFFWWLIYIIIVLSILIGDIGTFITSIGLVGLGLTFALQKPILNFVGWLTIILKNIYSEGDRIKVGNITGDVKEIQLMNTVLYGTLENTNTRSYKIITVPNELVLTTNVENYNKDSNYILEELSISITYESNYHKAMKLLENIVTKHLRENIKSYVKWKENEKARLLEVLKQFTHKKRNITEMELMGDKKEKIKNEIQQLEDLEEEFKPKIRIEMEESAVLLIVQFLTPYDQIKKNRTKINIEFLDAIGKEKDIEVAYPHMELVYDKKQ